MESCVSKRQMREHVFFVAFLMISFPLHISSSSLPSIPHSTLRNPDLWIVGAGNLGELIAKEWRTQFPDDIIISETITTNRHETLRKLGTIPLLRNQRDSLPRNCAKNVVISIPPSHQGDNSQYLSEIEEAIKLFDHSKNGMCLLISTTAVYPSDDGVVNEFSEVDRNPQNERAARALAAEDIILKSTLKKRGILRLAGLYSMTRGPHMYWLKSPSSNYNSVPSSNPLVNLVSYEDAASAAIKVLLNGSDGEVYLAADNEPLTKSEILNAVSPDTQICETKDQIKQGKVCDSSWTRRRIGWIPRYINFREYVKQKQLTQEIN